MYGPGYWGGYPYGYGGWGWKKRDGIEVDINADDEVTLSKRHGLAAAEKQHAAAPHDKYVPGRPGG